MTKTQLPSEVPKVHQLEFTPSSTETGFPLTPSVETDAAFTSPMIKTFEAVVTEAEDRAREAAEQDPRVRKGLGERFAYFEMETFPELRGVCPSDVSGSDRGGSTPIAGSITRLTYFSYSLNSTVIVCMQDDQVLTVGQLEDYQPPESLEEIEKAITLARTDDRLKGKLENLSGHAILVEPEAGWFFNLFGDLGAGNRVLWVTFSTPSERDPLYWALVDLTEEKVLDAGKEEKP